jgi:hypothetical protein
MQKRKEELPEGRDMSTNIERQEYMAHVHL